MWASALPDDRRRGERAQNPWHNDNQQPEGEDSRRYHNSEAVESPRLSSDEALSSDDASGRHEGTWGERDTGIPDRIMSMEEYETMRGELMTLTRTRSHRTREDTLFRIPTGRSARSARTLPRRLTSRRSEAAFSSADGQDDDDDVEAGETAIGDGEFELDQFMREGHFEKRKEGRSAKKVGVVWKHLAVKGTGATATFVRTLPDAILGTFGPDLYKIITGFFPKLSLSRKKVTRTLINDFSGVVRDGEMMLVLGRPGAGCSTFLKAIANNREGYAEVSGEISYGGISAEKQKKQFRGEVNYNPEDDTHLATLTVWQTLKFSLTNKTRKREKGEIPIIINALMKIFGISHTKHTLVGDEYVRGVSGGERKRVSIAETLASKSTVVCWDNSTRGLDSSTALDYAKSLRIMTDISNRTTFVTLYQAGEGIYALMDKVLVIDDGRCLFQGPAKDAKQYFIDLGYHCPERQTTPDFLTSITDPAARQFREGYEHKAPKTPEDLEKVFRESPSYQLVLSDIQKYEKEQAQSDFADAKEFEQTAKEQKSKTVRNRSSYTVSFPRQVMACTAREFWLILGDRTTLFTKFFIVISMGLIVGSLFYGQSMNTLGAFSRGGTLFFSTVFVGWLQLSELMKAVSGRAIVARHKDYAFYRPSAVSIARVVADIPMVFSLVAIFAIELYFMTDLDVDVSKFFIFLLFGYTTTMCLTALYRMFAALSPTIDDAVRFSGIALNLLVIYAGYVIPKPQLIGQYIWFGWLYYLNPLSYSFEGVIANEFSDRTMQCAPEQLVPQGPGIDPAYQGCSLPGSNINSHTVNGAQYLQTNYQYSRSNLWRNFGVLIAYTVLYILVTAIGTELFSFSASGGGALVFKKSRAAKKALKNDAPADEEKVTPADHRGSNSSSDSTFVDNRSPNRQQQQEEALPKIAKSDAVFTWKDVEYTVPYRGGERKLLNKVSGYAKPGKMVALMGASGAGKTTLLNTLSQRQKVGVINGDMLVDGKALGPAFQRGTGFVEQMDLHDNTATVREALEFSAILRQDRDIPRKEKLEYVDEIIDLLELNDLSDAIISSLGVEQKKRLTIAVELAAKPSLLLFLDEPTSGLDSNSAYSIIRFLRKLAAAGQAIVCTIHQPSSILIQQFDTILALNPGGNTFYFGPVGDNGADVIKYFADRGVQCPPGRNVAEFILETAAKGGKREGKRIDWNQEWLNSDMRSDLLSEIDKIHKERGQAKVEENTANQREFAAPIWTQTTMLTKRVFTQYWRDPSYLYGKLFISVIMGIFNGFTFYQLGYSIVDYQDRLFTCFLIITFPAIVVNGVVPKFYQNMALWQARELPSRIYGWIPFVTAMAVAEIPIAIVSAVIYWVLWYWPTGLPSESSVSGYVFLMTMLFFLFQASWGQWICAFAPSFTVISNVLPFFFVIFGLFNGVVRSWAQMPVFWRYFVYYLNPSTYWIGGILAATLHNQPVRCTTTETARFNAPPGQTCQAYAGGFVRAAGGYLLNPDATSDCMYCQYSSGDQYLTTLNIKASDKWRNFGIFLAFVISNYALIYFFIWTVRIKGWSFGFGYVFGGMGKLVKKVEGLFKKGEEKDAE